MKKIFSVGIVTYNSADEIRNVLDSLRLLTNYNEVEVYVCDNCSVDNTTDIVKNEYRDVHLIEGRKNLGFGRANNKIIQEVDSKYHVLVNPDIMLEKDIFLKIKEFMEKYPDVVQMAPKVKYENGTEQFLPKKNPTFKYLMAGKLEKIPYFNKIRKEYTLENYSINNIIDVEFCTGCFSVLRTDKLKKNGGFDERYFLYLEDADLTREMKRYGRTIYNPEIEVVHKWERVSHKSFKYFFIHLGSMFQYWWKWRRHDKTE